ncbi:Protein IMPAIRED IN BABA-INDUCED STERILITY 1, partial [Bienertia sinuspersici]
MGCISSKRAESASSAVDDDFEGGNRVKRSTNQRNDVGPTNGVGNGTHTNVYGGTQSLPARRLTDDEIIDGEDDTNTNNNNDSNQKSGRKLFMKGSKSKGSNSNFSLSLKFGSSRNQVVAEQTAAGWPGWLAAVAGTYSNVFRARENATGRLVALKKVRFDNYHPESVRFMAREITILRKLDHPNIIKLHGLITSKASCSIYLIKCVMQQIFYGLDYCHGKGVMHRDIKTSNILLNNEGQLKLADFGLANFMNTKGKQPRQLTSRVVTLWYRPPELLLGSTSYGSYVDLWSAGCVFAELLIGKPILKGKTEVEQLHKIFKLSGSPPDEYWNKSKLPHASMFKPQAPYESSLRGRFKIFPEYTVDLLQALLSIDPNNRGTAASALNSEYFNTMPYACDSSSLPKCSPNKEIDAKSREESRRRRTSRETQVNRKYARRNGTNALVSQIRKGGGDDEVAMDMKSNVSEVTNASQGDIMFAGNYNGKTTGLGALPPKSRSTNSYKDATNSSTSKNLLQTCKSADPSSVLCANKMLDPQPEE